MTQSQAVTKARFLTKLDRAMGECRHCRHLAHKQPTVHPLALLRTTDDMIIKA